MFQPHSNNPENDVEVLELKSIVSRTLEAKGVLGTIRAQLRAAVFTALDEQEKAAKGNEGEGIYMESRQVQNLTNSAEGRLLCGLIGEFFELNGLDNSLSVFTAEVNMKSSELPNRYLLARELNLVDENSDPNRVPPPLLILLVREIVKARNSQQQQRASTSAEQYTSAQPSPSSQSQSHPSPSFQLSTSSHFSNQPDLAPSSPSHQSRGGYSDVSDERRQKPPSPIFSQHSATSNNNNMSIHSDTHDVDANSITMPASPTKRVVAVSSPRSQDGRLSETSSFRGGGQQQQQRSPPRSPESTRSGFSLRSVQSSRTGASGQYPRSPISKSGAMQDDPMPSKTVSSPPRPVPLSTGSWGHSRGTGDVAAMEHDKDGGSLMSEQQSTVEEQTSLADGGESQRREEAQQSDSVDELDQSADAFDQGYQVEKITSPGGNIDSDAYDEQSFEAGDASVKGMLEESYDQDAESSYEGFSSSHGGDTLEDSVSKGSYREAASLGSVSQHPSVRSDAQSDKGSRASSRRSKRSPRSQQAEESMYSKEGESVQDTSVYSTASRRTDRSGGSSAKSPSLGRSSNNELSHPSLDEMSSASSVNESVGQPKSPPGVGAIPSTADGENDLHQLSIMSGASSPRESPYGQDVSFGESSVLSRKSGRSTKSARSTQSKQSARSSISKQSARSSTSKQSARSATSKQSARSSTSKQSAHSKASHKSRSSQHSEASHLSESEGQSGSAVTSPAPSPNAYVSPKSATSRRSKRSVQSKRSGSRVDEQSMDSSVQEMSFESFSEKSQATSRSYASAVLSPKKGDDAEMTDSFNQVPHGRIQLTESSMGSGHNGEDESYDQGEHELSERSLGQEQSFEQEESFEQDREASFEQDREASFEQDREASFEQEQSFEQDREASFEQSSTHGGDEDDYDYDFNADEESLGKEELSFEQSRDKSVDQDEQSKGDYEDEEYEEDEFEDIEEAGDDGASEEDEEVPEQSFDEISEEELLSGGDQDSDGSDYF